MKGLYIISCLAIFFQFGYSQEEVTLVLEDHSTQMLQHGAEAMWMCKLNQGYKYFMDFSVEWYHEFLWNGQNTTTELFSNAQNVDADPDVWELSTDMEDGSILFHLKLLSATPMHNGRIWCETGINENLIIEEANIVVYEELTAVELTFHGQTFTDDSGAEIQLELADPHTASCKASGANPGATDIQIMFDGVAQTKTAEDVIEPMASAATPMYSTSTSVEDIVTSKASEGKKVTCEARGPGPNGNLMRASVVLTVKIRDPQITCEDKDAYAGKRHVFIDCLVNTTGAFGPFPMSLHIASIGKTITIPGEQELEGDRIVIEDQVSGTDGQIHAIRIKMAEVEEWHLNTNFELSVKSKGDHITTHSTRLVRVGRQNTNTGPVLAASLTVCAVAMLAALRLH